MSRGGCGWKILRIADEKLSIRFSAILNDGISNLVIFKFQFKTRFFFSSYVTISFGIVPFDFSRSRLILDKFQLHIKINSSCVLVLIIISTRRFRLVLEGCVRLRIVLSIFEDSVRFRTVPKAYQQLCISRSGFDPLQRG